MKTARRVLSRSPAGCLAKQPVGVSREGRMSDKRITVWVQRFKDRPHLVLQWFDPDTGRRKSQSAGTADPKVAEQRRNDLEADLNHGRHLERGRLTWEK